MSKKYEDDPIPTQRDWEHKSMPGSFDPEWSASYKLLLAVPRAELARWHRDRMLESVDLYLPMPDKVLAYYLPAWIEYLNDPVFREGRDSASAFAFAFIVKERFKAIRAAGDPLMESIRQTLEGLVHDQSWVSSEEDREDLVTINDSLALFTE